MPTPAPEICPAVMVMMGDQFDRWQPSETLYCPQPILVMRARFEKAINHVHYLVEDMRRPKTEWASADKAHVFDFEDGLRLIVSRDAEKRIPSIAAWAGCLITQIHVSASLRYKSQLDLSFAPIVSREAFQAVIIEHLQQISNFVGELEDHFIGDPPKRILHLWFKEIR